MSIPKPEMENHEKGHDPNCPICVFPQRLLLERWYIDRSRTIKQLVAVFDFSEKLIHQHAKAVKIYSKRANNTKAIITLGLDMGMEKLQSNEFDMTLKDLQWFIHHQDKLLGRIIDKQENKQSPILHIHTTIPGVGGIANSDVKALKAAEMREKLPAAPSIIFEVPVKEAEDVTEK